MDKIYDYVFIGSGVATATTALYLLKKKPDASILILEAGDDFITKDRRSWWDYVTTDTAPYKFAEDDKEADEIISDPSNPGSKWGIAGSRLTVRGGTTVHWGGWSLRLKPEDFQVQKNTGRGCNWPFSYDELAPFYSEAESYLSVGGDSTDEVHYPQPPFDYVEADGPMIMAFEQLDISYQRMPIARYRKCMTTGTCKYCPFGSRYEAGSVLDQLQGKENVDIILNAAVSKLELSERGAVSSALLVGDKPKAFKGHHFIIAAGATESPKLLLQSKNDSWWPNGIGNDYDLVGRYLVGHRLFEVSGMLPDNPLRWQQALDFPTLMSRHYDSPQEQENGKLFMFKSRSNPKTNIAELMQTGKSHEQISHVVEGPMKMKLQGFMEDFGRFDNRVELGSKINAFNLPTTKVTFKHQQDFDERAYQRMKLMAKVLQKMGCSDISSKIRDARGDHASGTCRMHKEPSMGVVDANLKVHGMKNLYVCSNATFPSIGAVNPTLTLTALAVRLAKHLSDIR
jgi:choline dehydrogenase-like flavoprotein